MHQLLLIVLGAVLAVNGQDIRVSYDSQVLRLLLPLFDRDVQSVIFIYGYGDVRYRGQGIQTSDGWEYRTQVRLGDSAFVYADVYDSEGNVKTVGRTQITTASSSSLAAASSQLPLSRQLRAVIFRDDFNSAFNTNKWKYEVSMFGGMNWEFQVYTNDNRNVHTANGNLHIKPTLTANDPRFNENFLHTGTMDVAKIWGYCTNDGNYGCVRQGQNGLLPPIESGKVISIPTLRYGEVEVRARIPTGDWLWPAIWMMPKASAYGGWPRSGEIDIMESRGNHGPLGIGSASSTLHWGPSWDNNGWSKTHAERAASSGSYADNFRTWKLVWRPDGIRTFVNGNLILDVKPGQGFWQKGGFSGSNIWANGEKMAPFDKDEAKGSRNTVLKVYPNQRFFLMLNVAVGGTNGFFADGANWPHPKPWVNTSPHAPEDFWNARGNWLPTWQGKKVAMLVDYVEFRS